MSAKNAFSVVFLPSIVDEKFLAKAAAALERLRSESELRGHPMLTALLAIAVGEAEDALRTHLHTYRPPRQEQHDESVVRMAQKLAWRATARA